MPARQDPAPAAAPTMPLAGHDYPRTWQEFLRFFPDEAACARYLERLSWPDGFVCPGCNAVGVQPWHGSRRRLGCPSCGQQTTLTAGTLFQGTRTSLQQWFAAAWHVATAEEGISASALQRTLGLRSYETAWTMLHRYRRAMVRSGRPQLRGVVEVGQVPLAPSRGEARSTVAIAVEDRGEAEQGRVRMQRLAAATPEALAGFSAWAIDPDATVRGAGGTPAAGRHVALVAERLRGWLARTHHGACSPDQLDAYLDEFTFRFNRRTSRHRGLLFYRLLEEAVVTPPLPYDAIKSR